MLKKIDEQLQEEKKKYREAKTKEEAISDFKGNVQELRGKIFASRKALRDAYQAFSETVSQATAQDSQLEFEASVEIKKQELFEAVSSIFNNKQFRAFRETYNYDLLDIDDFEVDDGLFEAIWQALNEGTLSFKGGYDRQSAIERLFSNWYFIYYTVKSGNDTIGSMSPGKKALVLLEMIVNLEKSECPILIDQPEDDLDNRSIYTDLVSYLKSKKHERQIIVVTHNANVVVGADAEEVIIANQRGEEAPNWKTRFEYRSGAIEDSTAGFDEEGNAIPGVLYLKGIQEQICDILEGGKEAFELRRKKYLGT